MNKCCLKNFVPIEQVKYGGATYTRIKTVCVTVFTFVYNELDRQRYQCKQLITTVYGVINENYTNYHNNER